MKRPRRPLTVEPRTFDGFAGAMDPAERLQLAHDSARAFLARVRDAGDASVITRVLRYAETHGVDDLADLWAHTPAHSLPGALWRLWVIHGSIVRDPDGSSIDFRRGATDLDTVDTVVAGVPAPTGPGEIRDLADVILHGAFSGDLSDALDRAAAYCRIVAHGVTLEAESDATNHVALLSKAALLGDFADDLRACARRERRGELS